VNEGTYGGQTMIHGRDYEGIANPDKSSPCKSFNPQSFSQTLNLQASKRLTYRGFAKRSACQPDETNLSIPPPQDTTSLRAPRKRQFSVLVNEVSDEPVHLKVSEACIPAGWFINALNLEAPAAPDMVGHNSEWCII
jgi:hypothetical protein